MVECKDLDNSLIVKNGINIITFKYFIIQNILLLKYKVYINRKISCLYFIFIKLLFS